MTRNCDRHIGAQRCLFIIAEIAIYVQAAIPKDKTGSGRDEFK